MPRPFATLSLLPLLVLAVADPAAAQCDPNDPITGLPDLSYSHCSWSAAGNDPVTLLVVPDGTGAPFTQARLADGTVVDATITLTLDHPCGPFAGFPREDMWLEFGSGGFVSCAGGTIADADTDADGVTHWTLPLRRGGHSEGPCRLLINGYTPPGLLELPLRVNSPDLNGDGAVTLADVPVFALAYVGGYAFAADLHADGRVDLADLPLLARSLGARCP